MIMFYAFISYCIMIGYVLACMSKGDWDINKKKDMVHAAITILLSPVFLGIVLGIYLYKKTEDNMKR